MNYILKVFLLFILFGCQKNTTRFTGNAMTMDYRILIGENLSSAQKKAVQAIIEACFAEVDQIYNKWNPASEISRLNQLTANTQVPISEKLLRLLQITDEIYHLTEGRFDPTIEPLQKVWRAALLQGILPADESPAKFVGWKKIHFADGLFWKEHAECSLDLSGIAKGYAIDLILERLRDRLNLTHIFVEWGGEIRATGKHPEGRPWTIFISRFGDIRAINAIDTLPLQDKAIATSGDYLQNWTVDGITYCHIIDPHSLKPLRVHAKAISSASVLAPTCAVADGLATAAMIFPTVEEAKEWALRVQEIHPEIQFWLLQA